MRCQVALIVGPQRGTRRGRKRQSCRPHQPGNLRQFNLKGLTARDNALKHHLSRIGSCDFREPHHRVTSMPCGRVKMTKKDLRTCLSQALKIGKGCVDLLRSDHEPDLGRDPAGRLKDDLNGFLPGWAACCRPMLSPILDGQRNRLTISNSPRHHIGPRQCQRPHIRLVGGIGPVALILHLPYPTLHPATRDQPWADMMGDRTHVLEWLPRLNQVRES